MTTFQRSIEVHVPIKTAYNQWTQFEEFPQFMQGVREVRQLNEKRLLWRAEIAGHEESWDAEITEQQPDRRIAWRGVAGAQNAGTVDFERIDNDCTRVTLELEYSPRGIVEHVGSALGLVERHVEHDLECFKQFIEERGSATGGWRGEIQAEDKVASTEQASA